MLPHICLNTSTHIKKFHADIVDQDTGKYTYLKHLAMDKRPMHAGENQQCRPMAHFFLSF